MNSPKLLVCTGKEQAVIRRYSGRDFSEQELAQWIHDEPVQGTQAKPTRDEPRVQDRQFEDIADEQKENICADGQDKLGPPCFTGDQPQKKEGAE